MGHLGCDATLDALAARWRTSGAPADLVLLAEHIPPGTDKICLLTALGKPLVVSLLADGGESWLYVKSDAHYGQFESISVVLSATGHFVRLDRKPID